MLHSLLVPFFVIAHAFHIHAHLHACADEHSCHYIRARANLEGGAHSSRARASQTTYVAMGAARIEWCVIFVILTSTATVIGNTVHA